MIARTEAESTAPTEIHGLFVEPVGGVMKTNVYTNHSLLRHSSSLPIGPSSQRILSAWDSAGRCPSPAVPLVQDRRDERRAGAFEVRCRRLTCPSCIACRRGLWLSNFTQKIKEASESEQKLFLTKLDEVGWPAIRQRIERRKGEYARVRTLLAFVVVTTVDAGGQPISAGMAVEAVALALENLALNPGRKNKPISASAGWQLHERRGGLWRCRGLAPRGGFSNVMRLALEAGMPPKVRTTECGKFGGWYFHDNWTEAERAEFFEKAQGWPSHNASAASDAERRTA